MKLIHLSDLHIGKRVNEFSMLEDQKHILLQIIGIIEQQKPDALLIAGDVYDKSVPSAEAVQVFDDFLVRVAKFGIKTFIISGNHDSPERLAFGNRIMSKSGFHISPVYNKDIKPIVLMNGNQEIHIYMLPFIKPVHVRAQFTEQEINSYTDAVKIAVDNMDIDTTKTNVLITHQFVTGATSCESEDISVGGSDNVDVTVFEVFDYVALGHLHSPQKVGKETVRYCGTPLKYSFSECNHQKSVSLVNVYEKNNITVETIDLKPLHDMREIKGTYMEITNKSFYEIFDKNDYLHITLTDEDDILDAIGKLRAIYPNIMKLDYDNKRTQSNNSIDGAVDVEKKSPLELFAEFYELQNNLSMTEEQKVFVKDIAEKIWGEVL